MNEFIKTSKIKKLSEFVRFEDRFQKIRSLGITEIEIPFNGEICSWSCESTNPEMNTQVDVFYGFNIYKWHPIVVDFKLPMEGNNHDSKIHDWFRVHNSVHGKNITITEWGENDFGEVSKWYLINCTPRQVIFNTDNATQGMWDLSVTFEYTQANLLINT